mmetsp:Transcript_112478/g.257591  ORF Transcript_112478/g.257591 Transcript_112478/m.257591 type:complete len:211 (+) Transcript_112478:793-1425(+)
MDLQSSSTILLSSLYPLHVPLVLATQAGGNFCSRTSSSADIESHLFRPLRLYARAKSPSHSFRIWPEATALVICDGGTLASCLGTTGTKDGIRLLRRWRLGCGGGGLDEVTSRARLGCCNAGAPERAAAGTRLLRAPQPPPCVFPFARGEASSCDCTLGVRGVTLEENTGDFSVCNGGINEGRRGCWYGSGRKTKGRGSSGLLEPNASKG